MTALFASFPGTEHVSVTFAACLGKTNLGLLCFMTESDCISYDKNMDKILCIEFMVLGFSSIVTRHCCERM